MTHYFVDSSALVKRYIQETGTNWLRGQLKSDTGNICLVARVTQIEVMSAVSRQQREGHISPRTAIAIRLLLDRHLVREYLVVEFSNVIATRAVDLVEQHPLRAYDALQLATALESNVRITAAQLTPVTFLSADNRLLDVAAAVGLTTDNPNSHP